MPAFTFEKISSPVRSTMTRVSINQTSKPSQSKPAQAKQVSVKSSRGLIVQMLDRFAANRLQQSQSDADTAPPRKRPPPD